MPDFQCPKWETPGPAGHPRAPAALILDGPAAPPCPQRWRGNPPLCPSHTPAGVGCGVADGCPRGDLPAHLTPITHAFLPPHTRPPNQAPGSASPALRTAGIATARPIPPLLGGAAGRGEGDQAAYARHRTAGSSSSAVSRTPVCREEAASAGMRSAAHRPASPAGPQFWSFQDRLLEGAACARSTELGLAPSGGGGGRRVLLVSSTGRPT